MQISMFLGIFWTLFGIAGILGFQNIPSKYKGYSWTKDYIRAQGVSKLMLGLPWLFFSMVKSLCLTGIHLSGAILSLILCGLAIPSIIYMKKIDKKFNDLLAKEKE